MGAPFFNIFPKTFRSRITIFALYKLYLVCISWSKGQWPTVLGSRTFEENSGVHYGTRFRKKKGWNQAKHHFWTIAKAGNEYNEAQSTQKNNCSYFSYTIWISIFASSEEVYFICFVKWDTTNLQPLWNIHLDSSKS